MRALAIIGYIVTIGLVKSVPAGKIRRRSPKPIHIIAGGILPNVFFKAGPDGHGLPAIAWHRVTYLRFWCPVRITHKVQDYECPGSVFLGVAAIILAFYKINEILCAINAAGNPGVYNRQAGSFLVAVKVANPLFIAKFRRSATAGSAVARQNQ
jgi:hypothetical protein